MFQKIATGLAIAVLMTSAALAETFEVHMLNRGESGTMVFEPAFLQIANGDTVKFVASDRGHNAESISEMMPEGAAEFAGRINEEIEVSFDVDGLYGIKCKPHFAMGMVMTIAVGEAQEAPADFLEGRMSRKTKERFLEQLNNL